jgi:hypothetical protein
VPKKTVSSLRLDSGKPRSDNYVTWLEKCINVIRECQMTIWRGSVHGWRDNKESMCVRTVPQNSVNRFSDTSAAEGLHRFMRAMTSESSWISMQEAP